MQLLSNIGLSVPHPVRRGGWLLLTLLTVAVMVSSYAAAIVPCNAQPPDGYDFASTHMSIAHIDALQRRIVNTHVLQDWLFMAAATWFSGAQYFERSTDTVTFEAHLEAVSLNLPHIDRSGEIEITASTRVGELSTAINTLHWNGPDAPTVIYHHGGGEVPYTQTIEQIFPPGTANDLNVIAVRSPFHHESSVSVVENANNLSNYIAMMAVAVEVTEQLTNRYSPAVVTGYSLGGFVTSRHHLAYNSADTYVPFMAGTAHAEIFLTAYPAANKARTHPNALRDALNFTDAWSTANHDNVYPVLGMYDCLNALNIQGPSYGRTPVEVWDVGHISGLSAHRRLRRKILRAMK